MTKRKGAALLALVQRGVREVAELPEGLSLVVDQVEVGPATRTMTIYMTAFVLRSYERLFCIYCREPNCYASFFDLRGEERLGLGDFLRRRLGLTHPIEVAFKVLCECDRDTRRRLRVQRIVCSNLERLVGAGLVGSPQKRRYYVPAPPWRS